MAALRSEVRRVPASSCLGHTTGSGALLEELLTEEVQGTYILLDIDVNTSSTTNTDVNVVRRQILCSHLLQALGKGCREEKIAMIAISVCV